MEMEKSKVLIQFLLIFRQFGDVLFFLYARRLRGYTATNASHVLPRLVIRVTRISMYLTQKLQWLKISCELANCS